ncbi:MAG: 3-phosphoshikimate 1-carboxyvinyltransferase, partial [Methylocystis sp.]
MHSSHHDIQAPLSASPCGSLTGKIRPPGDKSVSHRSLILGLLAVGETKITGLLEGEDVLRTADACRQLGAKIVRHDNGDWSVWGAGLGSLLQPSESLDFGNAGTGSRLMMGVVAGHPIVVRFDGDASLRKRPMKRILDPLQLQGAQVLEQTDGGRLPLVIQGSSEPLPID